MEMIKNKDWEDFVKIFSIDRLIAAYKHKKIRKLKTSGINSSLISYII